VRDKKGNSLVTLTVNTIVADPNRANFTFIVGFNQGLPSTFASLSASIGSMEEHEINISEPCFLQSLLYLSKGILVAEGTSRNFAGEEYVFTFESRVQNSLATWSLIAICGCRIDLQDFSTSARFGKPLKRSSSRACSQS
jgi:hypothetical protein